MYVCVCVCVCIYIYIFTQGETEAQRGEMTYSRSPARWSKGQDHSLRLLIPWAPWRSSYVEFLREEVSVSRNPPTQQSQKAKGTPPSHCDHQKEIWGWGPGRRGCLGCRQPERYTNTHTCVVFSPIKSHPSINNLKCIHGHAINLRETRLHQGFPY